MRLLEKAVRILWTSPNTLLGVLIGTCGLLTGGRVQRARGCLEFWGGFTSWFLRRMPNGQFTLAMTLGHSILGTNRDALEISRDHEHIHVRQYETWGPLFIPAYLGWSGVLWFRGKDPYRDNPFEVEAFADDDRRRKLKN